MQNRVRKSYHTDIKIAVKLDVLSEETKKQIPRSSQHRFRNTDFLEYFGIELSEGIAEKLELIKLFAGDKTAMRIYKAYILIQHIYIKCFVAVPEEVPVEKKKRIVSLVERFRDLIGFEKILKLLKLTKYRFYQFCDQVKHQCRESVFKLCRRIHPNQLTPHETGKMKQLLEDKEFMGWPVFSVAHYALRKGIVAASVNTWYKYAKLLGIVKYRKKWHKGRKEGIRGRFIHDIWHVDVTIMFLLNRIKVYIYLVIENISRFILAYRISTELSAKLRLESLKEAYEKFILPIGKPEKTCLLVDGGTENNNATVEEYLKKEEVSIEKIVAQVDIEFSNSMIEAVNRTLKQRYLYYHKYPDINILEKIFEKAVSDYNEKCPHISHKGLTPGEVLAGKTLNRVDILSQMEQARKNRIEENRKANCGLC